MAKRDKAQADEAEIPPVGPKVNLARRVILDGFMTDTRLVNQVEARLTVRKIENEADDQLSELEPDDLAAALVYFTGHHVRVVVDVLD